MLGAVREASPVGGHPHPCEEPWNAQSFLPGILPGVGTSLGRRTVRKDRNPLIRMMLMYSWKEGKCN